MRCTSVVSLSLHFIWFAVVQRAVNGKETLDSLEVQLEDGAVRGYLAESYDGTPHMAFEGIPYARAPIGELRFRKPEKPARWTSPVEANKTYVCVQQLPIQFLGGVLGQEDCLYVNVYVPGVDLPAAQRSNRSVLVNVHGGSFYLGAPRLNAGPRYIMNEDVIYVSFNYRLGILGFLSTADNASSGNWGLKDQRQALAWIKCNIGRFGGNPASITLMGHSAGAASVHYLMLTEKAKGLFDRAALLSGTALNPWALTKDPLTKAQKLANIFACPTRDSHSLVACLRKVRSRELGAAMRQFFKLGNAFPVSPFGPVVEHPHDEALITKSAYRRLMDNEVANDVPLIFSFVANEGLLPVGYLATFGQIDTIKSKWQQVMQYGLDLQDTVAVSDWPATLQQIREYYYPRNDLSSENLTNLTQLWSDRFFLLAIEEAIRLHAKLSKHAVYVYRFTYDSPGFNMFPSMSGVAHCEDLQLMFKLVVSPSQLTEADEAMSHYMTAMLARFAQGSTPVAGWSPMQPDGDAIAYLEIASYSDNKMVAKTELAPHAFWAQLPIREEH